MRFQDAIGLSFRHQDFREVKILGGDSAADIYQASKNGGDPYALAGPGVRALLIKQGRVPWMLPLKAWLKTYRGSPMHGVHEHRDSVREALLAGCPVLPAAIADHVAHLEGHGCSQHIRAICPELLMDANEKARHFFAAGRVDDLVDLFAATPRKQQVALAEYAGIGGIYACKTKAEFVARVRRIAIANTPAMMAVCDELQEEGHTRYLLKEILAWAIANKQGRAGGPVTVPGDAPLEVKQAAYAQEIQGLCARLDDSPRNAAFKDMARREGYLPGPCQHPTAKVGGLQPGG